jgi:hypothetical protein
MDVKLYWTNGRGIYNAALSDNEVVALYKLEKTIDKIRES